MSKQCHNASDRKMDMCDLQYATETLGSFFVVGDAKPCLDVQLTDLLQLLLDNIYKGPSKEKLFHTWHVLKEFNVCNSMIFS